MKKQDELDARVMEELNVQTLLMSASSRIIEKDGGSEEVLDDAFKYGLGKSTNVHVK